MKKYPGRERRKITDLCHKISREIADSAKENGFGIAGEPEGDKEQHQQRENAQQKASFLEFRKTPVLHRL